MGACRASAFEPNPPPATVVTTNTAPEPCAKPATSGPKLAAVSNSAKLTPNDVQGLLKIRRQPRWPPAWRLNMAQCLLLKMLIRVIAADAAGDEFTE
jgi:hypothetical protein